MIYEGTIQYTVENGDNAKTKKETYLIDNCASFAEAEDALYDECEQNKDSDVIAIKRSKLKEIVNERKSKEERLFVCDLMDIVRDENDEEKEIVYRIALFAQNITSAHDYMTNYLKQGYDMSIVGLKMTKIIDVI